MSTHLLYLNDMTKLNFKASIIDKIQLSENKIGIILDQTYFYPTGGGQSHDIGYLDTISVLDVYMDNDRNVIHVVDKDINSSEVVGKVDGNRRRLNSQHHTGQHLLSQTLIQVLKLDTLSVKISSDSPSTIDINTTDDISLKLLNKVEDMANTVIFEDRSVTTYFIQNDQIQNIPFRRQPSMQDNIRVVEIADYDFSACGGTHCQSTGQIGLVKIISTERQSKKLRIHFVVASQALSYFRTYQRISFNISDMLDTSVENSIEVLRQRIAHHKNAQSKLQKLQENIAPLLAQTLVEDAEVFAAYRLIIEQYEDYSVAYLRNLARLIANYSNTIAVLGSSDGGKLSMVISCGENVVLDARELLELHLKPLAGRGGGKNNLAQGGGNASSEQISKAFSSTRDYINELLR